MKLSWSVLLVLLTSVPVRAQSEETPRSWLVLGLEHRNRYETMSNRFRKGETGGDQQLAQRSRIQLEIRDVLGAFSFYTELQDARVFLVDEGSFVNTTHVDENDILQLQLRVDGQRLLGTRTPARLDLGRFSMDLGSRRLIARHRMRNAINAWDGLRFTMGTDENWSFCGLLTRPVERKAKTLDPVNPHATFWGAFFHKANLGGFRFDGYYFGLSEDEETSSQRKYTTIGTRWFKSPARGELDFQIESAWQFGTYRGLDHFAHYQHAELGYLVDGSWAPRIIFQYDYGSGDDDPEDDKHGGFDHLFGARRGDYNPTGIYTPYYRPNLQTPGVRLFLNPSSEVDAMAVFRAFWLAHARDAWARSGLQDPTGNSGAFLGNQIETRLRWRALPQTTFEAGWTHMFKGSYLKRVPESPQTGDTDYFYVSVELTLEVLPFSAGE